MTATIRNAGATSSVQVFELGGNRTLNPQIKSPLSASRFPKNLANSSRLHGEDDADRRSAYNFRATSAGGVA